MANMLLPVEFVNDVYRFTALLDGRLDDDYLEGLRSKIEKQIGEKIEALNKREAFTQYKSAQRGSDEREAARRHYLDQAGVHRDWRSQKEIDPE